MANGMTTPRKQPVYHRDNKVNNSKLDCYCLKLSDKISILSKLSHTAMAM